MVQGSRSVRARLLALGATLALIASFLPQSAGTAEALPSGFTESTVFSGLTTPTKIVFANDGRVFVAEKGGKIKVFDSLTDTTATVVADLSTNVYDYWDRGLLGFTLAPNFPTDPYAYVLYTYDHILGDPNPPPRWNDSCGDPLGDGCLASGRLTRFQISGNQMVGSEQPLIEDWCIQYPSHAIGDLRFGTDGKLYVSAGDGASFGFNDYGQDGNPVNPCNDPPGGSMSPPTAEGGALRSQDIRTTGDPQGFDGTILRLEAATGAAAAGNPLIGNPDPNVRRIIATGFRNPFRTTIRPGTNEVWAGDVGQGAWEEIDRVNWSTTLMNHGWPCYEGAPRMGGFDAINLNICENLYAAGPTAVTSPHYAYQHGVKVAGETCGTGNSSISGLAFYTGTLYPSTYQDSLFFADYSRDCIWVMFKGANGLPDATNIVPFLTPAANPVDLEVGPGGDIFYADFDGGTIRRIRYQSAANQAPTAHATANPTSGPAPLTVNFSATTSTDPDGDPLAYAWDLDADGAYDDSTSATPSFIYANAGSVTVGLRATDPGGLSDTDTVTVTATGASNTPPTPSITSPASSLTWAVGDEIDYAGGATDAEDGTLGAAALTWTLIMHHCNVDGTCHTHQIEQFVGVKTGSFIAPDHEWPSHLELKLTATDSAGASASTSVELEPKTVDLTFASAPVNGLEIVVSNLSGTTPFTRTFIVNGRTTATAVTPQTVGTSLYEFSSWSDGGAQSHEITAPATPTTYTATFTKKTLVTILPAADAYVRAQQGGKNFGTANVLRVRSGQFRSYLRFTVSGLTGTVTGAKLRLRVTDASANGGRVYAVGGTWTETGITWNNAPAITGSPIATIGNAPLNTWVEVSLGSFVTGNGTYNIAISDGSSDVVDYRSRETVDDPQLVITTNP
jgi:glucose/arabinose dehydrogenase/PKD repeat protein